jgi:multiple sugar transport system permease protein/trehalose/maltose transport system permease protein
MPALMPGLRRIGFLAALAAIVVWSVGPFLWQVVASFQPDSELTRDTPKWLPIPPTLDHYRNVFEVKHFQRYIVNSVIVVGITTLLAVAIGSLCAYALARFNVRRPMSFLGVILAVSMFPQIALVAPLYLTIRSFDSLNTYRGLILIYVSFGLPLIVWVMYGYFRALPQSLDEAAKIDGAGPLRILWSVLLPLSAPGLVTTALLAFIAAWNELMFALAFTSDIDHQTIPVGIANFTELYYIPWGDVAAASVVVTIPLVALVLVFQRRIVDGLTAGAVKD